MKTASKHSYQSLSSLKAEPTLINAGIYSSMDSYRERRALRRRLCEAVLRDELATPADRAMHADSALSDTVLAVKQSGREDVPGGAQLSAGVRPVVQMSWVCS